MVMANKYELRCIVAILSSYESPHQNVVDEPGELGNAMGYHNKHKENIAFHPQTSAWLYMKVHDAL